MPSPSTVLVVDDNFDLADNLREILEDVGLRVDVAYSGQQAVKLIRKRRYKLVLTDMRMPGVDGLALVRLLRAEFPGTPIAVMTAYTTEQTLEDARTLGILSAFAKPLDHAKIVAFVAAKVQSKRHVLVVEDDDAMRSSLVELLQEVEDIVPHAVADTSSAHRVLADLGQVQGAVIDVRLPDGDGWSVGNAVRRVCASDVPLVFVSGFTQELEPRQQEPPPSARTVFLEKPFSPQLLLEKVCQWA